MKKSTKLFCSLSFLTCFTINAMAEEKVDLGEISIIDTALEAQIKSISSQKLENIQASDIKDILKSMPSVIVDGDARYSQKVYIRGLEDKSSNITIDGAKISGQLFHHSGDQTIDAEMLKIGSIELGPNSALSGTGVINGSFVYETKDPSDYLEEGEKFGGKISASYQSGFGRKAYNVAVFSKINNMLEFVGIGNISEDTKIEVPKKEDLKTKQSKLKSGLIKLIFKPSDENTFKLSYNKYSDGGIRQLAGEKPEDELAPYNEITRDTYSLNYKYTPNNDMINIEANAYISSQALEIEGGKDRRYWVWKDYADEPAIKFENKTSGVDLRNTSFFNKHKITYGASFGKEKQSSKANGLAVVSRNDNGNLGKTYDFSVNGGEVKEYGFYIEDEIDLNKLLLTLGARYDIHKLGGVYSGKNSQLSPKFKAEYQSSDNLKFRAGYGRIFKGPSLGETLMIVNGLSSNTEYKAQKGHNFELGFDYDLSNTLNTNNSILGFTAYKYNVDNYMHPSGNNVLKSQDNIEIWGLETIYRQESDKFGLSLSHTYTGGEAEYISTGVKYEPKATKIHVFKADFDYFYNKELSFNYNGEFVPSNKRDFYEPRESKIIKTKRDSYHVHNISMTYKPKMLKGAKLNFGIDNVFDKKYARHTAFGTEWDYGEKYRFYEVGRNFKFNLSYKF